VTATLSWTITIGGSYANAYFVSIRGNIIAYTGLSGVTVARLLPNGQVSQVGDALSLRKGISVGASSIVITSNYYIILGEAGNLNQFAGAVYVFQPNTLAGSNEMTPTAVDAADSGGILSWSIYQIINGPVASSNFGQIVAVDSAFRIITAASFLFKVYVYDSTAGTGSGGVSGSDGDTRSRVSLQVGLGLGLGLGLAAIFAVCVGVHWYWIRGKAAASVSASPSSVEKDTPVVVPEYNAEMAAVVVKSPMQV